MKIDAVLFDLDGTLLNTLQDLTDATNAILSQYGKPERTAEEIRSFIGNGLKKLMERAFETDGEDLTAQGEAWRAEYLKRLTDKTEPHAGIIDLLKALKARGIKTGVVSNKFDAATQALCERKLPGLIDIAIGEAHKPSPEKVLAAMETLQAKSVIFVGDSDVDIQTAQNAGIPCIAVPWGFRSRESLEKAFPDAIADTPETLLMILKELEKL